MKRGRQWTSSDRIAAFAAVVSLLSLAASIWTVAEQRRQWRATNIGRVELVKAAFVYWRTFDEKELVGLQWGYNVNLMPLMEENRVTNRYGLPSRLIAFDPGTNRTFVNYTGVTRAEIESKMKSASDLPPSCIIAKQFQIQFDFQNSGGTPVTDLQIAIQPKQPDTGEWQERPFGQPVELSPGHTVFNLLEMNAPIDAFLPDKLAVRVLLKYRTIDGEFVSRTIPVYYNGPSGSFNLGEA